MGDELVSNSSQPATLNAKDYPTYEYVFNTKFPYYLSIGMSEDQYWDKDCTLVKYYREAEEMRKEKANQEAWLQGMYIYDAIMRLTPILRAFAKKGSKPTPYVEEPYPINKKSQEEAQERKEKALYDKGLMYMKSFMSKQSNKEKE